MRRPGIEPGSIAWKATMLTFTPPTLSGSLKSCQEPGNRLITLLKGLTLTAVSDQSININYWLKNSKSNNWSP